MISATLICHPESHCRSVQTIAARATWTRGGSLALTYLLTGALNRLKLPPSKFPQRADGLWKRTCFELFAAEEGSAAYCEFNFSPSGEWALYGFRGYRKKTKLEDEKFQPDITVRVKEDRLKLNAVVDFEPLKKIASTASLRIGFSAVIEERRGMRSYWALRHPPGKPDFHHPDSFALRLQPLKVDAVPDPAYTGKA